jgi:membrane-associated phospholipid phosphatase
LSDSKSGSDRANRRQFFGALAGAGSALVAGSATAGPAQAADIPSGASGRLASAYQMRLRLAEYYRNMPAADHRDNGDERNLPDFIGSYAKTLRHNQFGEVLPGAYETMLNAIRSGRSGDWAAVEMGGLRGRLKTPQGALTYQLCGADPSQFAVPPAPAFSSAETAGEMVELYWLALLRDVPFEQYESHPLVAEACAELNRLSDFHGAREAGAVTPRTIFRFDLPDALEGPFVSQFLLKPTSSGVHEIPQKMRSAPPGSDFLYYEIELLERLNGVAKGDPIGLEEVARHLRSCRDLAEYVHRDLSYLPHLDALMCAQKWGPLAYSENNPYVWNEKEEGYINFGYPDFVGMVAAAGKPAFHATWFQKWQVHRRLRPEEFGMRLHQHLLQRRVYPIHADLLNAGVLERSREKFNRQVLLSSSYPEGCPTHSAYPSGHSTIAGACVTVLKALLRHDFEIPDPVQPAADGMELKPYTGGRLTIGGELNKLAWNIGLGRMASGIHYRSDVRDGIMLGEQVAIGLLREIATTYTEDFGGFAFNTFSGERVEIGRM